MGRDVEIADAGVIGKRDRHRGLQPALPSSRFEDVGDGAGAQGVPLERAVDRRGELLRAVVGEQREEPRGVDAERFARITRVSNGFENVQAGIQAANKAGLSPVKVNCVRK